MYYDKPNELEYIKSCGIVWFPGIKYKNHVNALGFVQLVGNNTTAT